MQDCGTGKHSCWFWKDKWIRTFIHPGHFYSASSSPLLLRNAPDTARILCQSFTPKRHIICIHGLTALLSLQSAMNSAAVIVISNLLESRAQGSLLVSLGTPIYLPIWLMSCNWLSVAPCIQYKVLLSVAQAQQDFAPKYICKTNVKICSLFQPSPVSRSSQFASSSDLDCPVPTLCHCGPLYVEWPTRTIYIEILMVSHPHPFFASSIHPFIHTPIHSSTHPSK